MLHLRLLPAVPCRNCYYCLVSISIIDLERWLGKMIKIKHLKYDQCHEGIATTVWSALFSIFIIDPERLSTKALPEVNWTQLLLFFVTPTENSQHCTKKTKLSKIWNTWQKRQTIGGYWKDIINQHGSIPRDYQKVDKNGDLALYLTLGIAL